MSSKLAFEVITPLGFSVRCTAEYWHLLSTAKHPVLHGHLELVIKALRDPSEIRRSRKDREVLLFYRGRRPRWMCAVVGRHGIVGYLITAYPTDSIKVGEFLWKKSR